VFWSKKHYLKSRSERNELIEKAEKLIANPGKYTKATSYGAAAYVDNLEYDKDTGDILDKGVILALNKMKIEEEEKLDGYYSIVTSEIQMDSFSIVDTYRGLWEIEETFKITKSELEARPVFVYDEDSIRAHFLTCFISLVIVRLIQKKIKKEYSSAEIIDCLNKIQCIHEHENIYLLGYRSVISDLLGDIFGFDFTKKRLWLSSIKNISASAKMC
jgi:transposase